MRYFARICAHARSWREFAKCCFVHFPSFFSVHVDTYAKVFTRSDNLVQANNGNIWVVWEKCGTLLFSVDFYPLGGPYKESEGCGRHTLGHFEKSKMAAI